VKEGRTKKEKVEEDKEPKNLQRTRETNRKNQDMVKVFLNQLMRVVLFMQFYFLSIFILHLTRNMMLIKIQLCFIAK
jgi:hypothetical protein